MSGRRDWMSVLTGRHVRIRSESPHNRVRHDLPDRLQLVWHGVNDEANLGEFLSSSIHWGECDVRRDQQQRLVLHHDSLACTRRPDGEALLSFSILVEAFAAQKRGLKLDLKDGPDIVEDVLGLVKRHGFDDSCLWFNASIETLGADGFRRLGAEHPGAVLQCPVDFLAPLVSAAPPQARAVLRTLAGWGINRVSVAWGSPGTRLLVGQLEAWGYDVNLYGVPDHQSFLQAVLLAPRSLTADFNFPEWDYYGRGSGEGRQYHRYPGRESPAAV